MAFDIDLFQATDPSMDAAVSHAARKLVRRGYGLASIEATDPIEAGFTWGWGSKGTRSVRTWALAVSGAPGIPDFEGVLSIRETTMTYASADPRDVPSAPEKRWYEYLPDSAETAKVLKSNDGY